MPSVGGLKAFQSETMLIIPAVFLRVIQFSGQCADEMRKTYAEFCSGHLKAVKLYKELLARDKRLQYFIRVRAKRNDSFSFILIIRGSIFICIIFVRTHQCVLCALRTDPPF